jgi:hypothetical protein
VLQMSTTDAMCPYKIILKKKIGDFSPILSSY